jgi:hypothetical protein
VKGDRKVRNSRRHTGSRWSLGPLTYAVGYSDLHSVGRCPRMARLSSSKKSLECFARTGGYAPGTMFPNRRCLPTATSYARVGITTLEGHTQPKLDLPGRAERVDPGSDPDTVYIVAKGSSSIDLSRSSGEQAVE